MSKGTMIGLGIAGFIVLMLLYFGLSWGPGIYNRAVAAQEEVNASWGNVQATNQRRADLIPQLVATVKGAAENERGILTAVTQARAGIVNAKTPEDLELAGRQINTAINLAFEAYPQIRSTENFQDLQAQLEGTENRINVARQNYNEAIKLYNTFVRGFWQQKALSFFGRGEDFSVRSGFEANQDAQEAPKVDFSN
jgi:LemA protein